MDGFYSTDILIFSSNKPVNLEQTHRSRCQNFPVWSCDAKAVASDAAKKVIWAKTARKPNRNKNKKVRNLFFLLDDGCTVTVQIRLNKNRIKNILRMDCLFCRQSHPDTYICEARCEARLSAIWAKPKRLHQLTLEECMPNCMANRKRTRGKKRPASVPTDFGNIDFLNYIILVKLT